VHISKYAKKIQINLHFQAKFLYISNICCNFAPSLGAYGKDERNSESRIGMLSGVLRSPQAVNMNIQIMRAFVAMRRFLARTYVL